MREYLEKKNKGAKVWLVLLIVSVLIFAASVFVVALSGEIAMVSLMMISGAVMWTVFCVFLICHLPVLKNYSYLKNKDLLNIADDISFEATPAAAKSKIYCGKNALYSKKARTVIPYSQIVWVHMYEKRVNGITVEKALILHTPEGKKFTVPCTNEEAQMILGGYILPAFSNMILGYGVEQIQRYKNEYPMSQAPKKLAQRIWGIILMAIGIAFLIMLIINIKEAEIVPASLITAGCLIGGGVLFAFGNKKIG